MRTLAAKASLPLHSYPSAPAWNRNLDCPLRARSTHPIRECVRLWQRLPPLLQRKPSVADIDLNPRVRLRRGSAPNLNCECRESVDAVDQDEETDPSTNQRSRAE